MAAFTHVFSLYIICLSTRMELIGHAIFLQRMGAFLSRIGTGNDRLVTRVAFSVFNDNFYINTFERQKAKGGKEMYSPHSIKFKL